MVRGKRPDHSASLSFQGESSLFSRVTVAIDYYTQNPPLKGEAEPAPERSRRGAFFATQYLRVWPASFAIRLRPPARAVPPPLSTRVRPCIFFCSSTAFSLVLAGECAYSVASFAVAVRSIPMFAKRAHEVSETLEDPDPAVLRRSRPRVHYRKRRQ